MNANANQWHTSFINKFETMEQQRGEQLLEKLKNETLTQEERIVLEDWYTSYANSAAPLMDEKIYKQRMQEMDTAFPFLPAARQKAYKLWLRLAAAAAILLVVGAGLFYFNQSGNGLFNGDQNASKALYASDVAPGKNTATLTLSNGKKVILSSSKTGIVFNASKLSYNDGSSLQEETVSEKMATLNTPRGGQYQVILSDGTKVWLNAASSLKFPSNFTGNKRSVELIGEAYFEVAHDKKHPFTVKTTKQDVTVLGTHFNINSYDNETTAKTTLLEGSVQISSLRGGMLKQSSSERLPIVLKPREQATSFSNGAIKVAPADIELAVAWKNNKFMFDHDKIENIMRMVERWYNVEVVYEGEIPTDEFGGSVSRFDKVSKVLSILELTGNVHFKVEGRRITVTK